jgi:hypothetical protein
VTSPQRSDTQGPSTSPKDFPVTSPGEVGMPHDLREREMGLNVVRDATAVGFSVLAPTSSPESLGARKSDTSGHSRRPPTSPDLPDDLPRGGQGKGG